MATIQDLLGRVIQLEENTSTILQQLASGMKGGVGAATTGESPVVKSLSKLISNSAEQNDKIEKAVKALPQQITNPIIKAIDQVAKMAANLAAQSIGKGGRNSDKADKAAIDQLNMFKKKGTGYVEDVEGGKKIDNATDVLKNIYKYIEKSGIGKKNEMEFTLQSKGFDNLEGLGSVLQDALNTNEKTTLEYYKQKSILGEKYKSIKQGIDITGLEDNLARDILEEHIKLESKLIEANKLTKQGLQISAGLKTEIEQSADNLEVLNRKAQEFKETSAVIKGTWESIKNWGKDLLRAEIGLKAIERLRRPFQDLQEASKGMVVETSRFGYYLAGATGAGNKIQTQIRNTVKELAAGGAEAADISEYYKQWPKFIKSGYRSLYQSGKVLQRSMSFAKLIGSSTETTAEEFKAWHMQLGLTESQMGNLSRSMQNVSRRTGITGDNMVELVKSTRDVAIQFRDAGLYSKRMEENIAGILGEAGKVGAQEFAKDFLVDISKGANFNKMGKMGQLIMRSGGGETLMTGGGATKEGQREILSGIEGLVKKLILGDLADRIVDPITGAFDMEKFEALDEKTRTQINLMSENIAGYPIGQLLVGLNAIREGQKSASQKLTDAEKQLGAINSGQIRASAIEKQKLEEQIGMLKQNVTKEEFNNNLTALNRAANFAKQGDVTMSQMLKKIGEETKRDPNEVLQATVKDLNERAIKAGRKDLVVSTKNITSLNEQGYMDMIAQLDKNATTLANVEASSTNLEDKRLLTERSFRKGLFEALDKINETLSGMPVWASFLGDVISGTIAQAGWEGAKAIGKAILGPRAAPAGKAMGNALNAAPTLAKATPTTLAKATPKTMLAPGLTRAAPAAPLGGLAGRAAMIPKAAPAAAAAAPGMLGGIGKAATGIFGGFGRALGGIAKLGVKAIPVVGWVIAGLEAAIGGVVGSFQAGANAAKIFGVEEDKVTAAQKASAQEAGFVTGIFNALTFGLLDGVFGANGWLTIGLAKFFNALGPLKYVLFPILLVIDVLVGTLKVLWSALKLVGKVVWAVIKPFWKVFETIKTAIGNIFAPLLRLFGIDFGESGGELTAIFDKIAKWIDDLEPDLEEISKWVEDYIVDPFIEWLLPIFEDLADRVIILVDYLKSLWKVISGLFTGDMSKVWDGLKGMGKAIWEMLKKNFFDLPRMLAGWLFNAIKFNFVTFPKKVGKFIGDAAVEGMTWLVTKIKEVWQELVDWIMSKIPKLPSLEGAPAPGAPPGTSAPGAFGPTGGGTRGLKKGGLRYGIAGLAGLSGLGIAALGDLTGWFQHGGMVGGAAGAIPIMAHAGEAILNQKQQQSIMDALSNKFGESSSQVLKLMSAQAAIQSAIVAKTVGGMPGMATAIQMLRTGATPGTEADSKAPKQIAENTEMTAENTEKVVDLLQQLLLVFTTGGAAGGGGAKGRGSAKNLRAPMGSIDYFAWPAGNMGDSPGLGYVNSGRVVK